MISFFVQKKVFLAIVTILFCQTEALSFCSEPSFSSNAPDAPSSFQKPDVPYCLSSYSYSKKHTCEDWEIDFYIDEVNEYIRKLNDYSNEANDFAREAVGYASDAAAFAKCQAEDVKSQAE